MSERIVPSKRKAPKLWVSYRCPLPKCMYTAVLDAYRGVPSCSKDHSPEFMEPMFIVKEGNSSPLADIEAMRHTDRGAFS